MKNGKTVAIVPGSFDPITYGHIDIVKRAAEMYDIVYLAVMINSEKKYLFTLEEREKIASCALSSFENVNVISSSGMLWKLAQDLNADAIVKGYRNQADYDYEMKMAQYNAEHNPNAKTVLLKASESLLDVSSTAVRKLISENQPLDKYLPEDVAKAVKEIISSKQK